MLKLPGLIDPHVHVREPGATHKEDWDTCTAAALAGGFTTILAMPNTKPAVTDAATLGLALDAARAKARCDYAHYLGAGADNLDSAAALAPRTAGLKLYLDQTYGPLRLDDTTLWLEHLRRWPAAVPVAAHAEGRSVAALIMMATLAGRPVHICHVATREEILVIRAAKEHGLPVTCEVAPHHLFLSTEDTSRLPGRGEVRPRLASPADRAALLANLDIIDCFATDHAPHTLDEKAGDNPPPGFPGLETALSMMLTLVHQGHLDMDGLLARMVTNPRRIFNLPETPDTWVEVDPEAEYTISSKNAFTRCAWTPFEGWRVRGRVQRVVLRGKEVYSDGQLTGQPGDGRNLRD